MLLLGQKQKLIMVKQVEFGVYLKDPNTDDEQEKVLLPSKQVPDGLKIKDEVEVFLYKDSKDRLIATTKEPLIKLNEVKRLRVKDIGDMGAFVDCGLEKDLFLPFKEQTIKVKQGDECLVALYIDKSTRLCATMKIYHYLKKDSIYKKDDKVTGMVYEISDNFGAFVAIDDIYSGLIPKKEMVSNLKVMDEVNARVTAVKEDGKLDLSIREKSYIQMSIDAENVMERLEKLGGVIPFTDKASPELIRSEMNMSKNEFKRAVGNLMKAGKIKITEKEIRRI